MLDGVDASIGGPGRTNPENEDGASTWRQGNVDPLAVGFATKLKQRNKRDNRGKRKKRNGMKRRRRKKKKKKKERKKERERERKKER